MKYPIEEKSIKELVEEACKELEHVSAMTEEEEIEDDADGGFFQDEDD